MSKRTKTFSRLIGYKHDNSLYARSMFLMDRRLTIEHYSQIKLNRLIGTKYHNQYRNLVIK